MQQNLREYIDRLMAEGYNVRDDQGDDPMLIAPDGKVVFVHSDLVWKDHVAKTLAAVRALRAGTERSHG